MIPNIVNFIVIAFIFFLILVLSSLLVMNVVGLARTLLPSKARYVVAVYRNDAEHSWTEFVHPVTRKKARKLALDWMKRNFSYHYAVLYLRRYGNAKTLDASFEKVERIPSPWYGQE